ncbi:hypothetical protein GCM10027346_41470 [Hymenobacter seoulensis]
MVQYLEELLHSKTKDSPSSILFAQWSYDKKVVPSALQAVSNLFPHYSLHDESHSVTIINNIVRILGKDNLSKLSAIDIWFILEAAYWHDLGMVVSGEQLVKAINSPEFIQFVVELINDKKHGLHDFAIKFEIVDGKLKSKDSAYNLELNDSIKFILAEFFRWRHADRSQDIINNPLQEIHIVSPRGVIPKRIIKILGRICSCHTKDFIEVMKLPFCEVGIDIEDAHPRFIACLLRIGDLLDLDNNRFSEVMLRTLTRIPVDTLNHKAKHLSIEAFRVDREKIEITANCEDYDTANITQHWFNYLNSEISSQMINWNKIVPSKDLGYLPTIGSLKVELKNYDLIDGKHKPQFSVDTDKALALLQGAGIYDGAYQSLREILQNAVDSTLIRVWLEHNDDLDLASPLSSDFSKIANNYTIQVGINKGEIEEGMISWNIKIQDKGTGISKNDLKFLMNTGSSSKNYDRKGIIDKMPVWMKPSGTFGIGFQSIFMVTDEVTIETKSFFDEQFQVIELNSPNSKKDGGILIKKDKSNHATKPGVIMKFTHKTKAIPDRYAVSFDHLNATNVVHNFDPFRHDSMDVEVAKMIDEIINFSRKSYFPVKLNFDNNNIDIKSDWENFEYYDDTTHLGMNIFIADPNRVASLISYYKSQKVENNLRNEFDFLRFEVNIHKDVASEVLTLNRNKIRDEYNKVLLNDILNTSFKILTSNFSSIASDEGKAIIASMFLNYYANDSLYKQYEIHKYQNWKNYKLILEEGEFALGDMMSMVNTVKLIYFTSEESKKGYMSYVDNCLSIYGSVNHASDYCTKFIINKVSREFMGSQRIFNDENGRSQIIFFRDTDEMGFVDLAGLMLILKSENFHGSRAAIPCPNEFYNLRIKQDAHIHYLGRHVPDHNFTVRYHKMISPFILTQKRKSASVYEVSLNEKLYDWVYENRFDVNIAKDDIKKAYEELCAKIDIDDLNRILTTRQKSYEIE